MHVCVLIYKKGVDYLCSYITHLKEVHLRYSHIITKVMFCAIRIDIPINAMLYNQCFQCTKWALLFGMASLYGVMYLLLKVLFCVVRIHTPINALLLESVV